MTKSERVTTTNFINSSSVCIDEVTDTKGIFRTRTSKDRQHNDQTKTDKRTNNRSAGHGIIDGDCLVTNIKE
jgi:hypothetical protein